MEDLLKRTNIARTFINWLFELAITDHENLHFQIWTFPDKKTAFFNDAEEGAKYAIQRAESQNVYLCMGLYKKPFPMDDRRRLRRGKLEEVWGIPGFWGDIDIAFAGAHKKKDLPQNDQMAGKILDTVGVPPSTLIYSGHGLQPYWLFKEPWIFENEKERDKAVKSSALWGATLKHCAKVNKCVVDAVHDITRVLRMPGTFNRKIPEDLKEVRIRMPHIGDPIRYDLEDLSPFMIAQELADVDNSRYEFIDPVALGNRGVPKVIDVMCGNDPRFKKTWERKRNDFSDQSASEYDMSIANTMVLSGCDDQTIADAIYAWRAKHNEDTKKAERRDYLMRTIGKARKMGKHTGVIKDIMHDDEVPPQLPPPESKESVPEDLMRELIAKRKERYEQTSQVWTVDLVGFYKYGNENPRFSFSVKQIDGKTTTPAIIGDGGALNNQDKVRGRILELTGVNIPVFKKVVWQKIISNLVQVAEWFNIEDDSKAARIREYIGKYSNGHKRVMFQEGTGKGAVAKSCPFIKKGLFHLNASHFQEWMMQSMGWEVNLNDLVVHLKTMSFVNRVISVRLKGQSGSRCSRRYWSKALDDLVDIMPLDDFDSVGVDEDEEEGSEED